MKKAFAIHLTDTWAAAVEGHRKPEGLEVERATWFEFPEGVEPGKALAEGLSSAGFTARAAQVVLAADQGLLRSFRLPGGSTAERLQMVHLQVEKDLPFPIERARVAWVPAGPTVRVGVVRADVFERAEALVRSAGLTLAGMTLSPLAASAALGAARGACEGEMRALLLAEGSRLAILFDEPGGDFVVRSIPYGEHHLEEGVVPWADAFAREFGRTRNAFRTRHPEIRRLVVAVAGPERELESLLAVARTTGADETIVLAPPGGGISVSATAAGALATGAAGDGAGLDFVTSVVRIRRFRLPTGRGRTIALAAAAVAVLALPMAFRAWYGSRVDDLERRAAEARAEKKRLEPDLERATELSSWSHERIPWIDVQRDLAVLVDNRTIVLSSFTGHQDAAVRVTGSSKTEAAVLEFVGRVNRDGKYRARLGGTSIREKKTGPARDFPVEFDLTLEPSSLRRVRLLTPVEAASGEKP